MARYYLHILEYLTTGIFSITYCFLICFILSLQLIFINVATIFIVFYFVLFQCF